MGTIIGVRIIRFEHCYGSKPEEAMTEAERKEVKLLRKRQEGKEWRERHKVRGRK